MVHRYGNPERQTRVESEGAAEGRADAGVSRRIRRVGGPAMALPLAVLAVVSAVLWMQVALAMTCPGRAGADSMGNAGLRTWTAGAVPEVVETIFLEGDAQPIAAAANPNDSLAYVVNIGTGTVAVIQGKELLTTIDLKTVPSGATACPEPVALGSCLNDVVINRVTNHAYVTEWYHDLAQIISGTEVVDSV